MQKETYHEKQQNNILKIRDVQNFAHLLFWGYHYHYHDIMVYLYVLITDMLKIGNLYMS